MWDLYELCRSGERGLWAAESSFTLSQDLAAQALLLCHTLPYTLAGGMYTHGAVPP